MTTFRFCWCGRKAMTGVKKCRKHYGQRKPRVATKPRVIRQTLGRPPMFDLTPAQIEARLARVDAQKNRTRWRAA